MLFNDCLLTQNQNWHQGYEILAIKTEKNHAFKKHTHLYFAESVY